MNYKQIYTEEYFNGNDSFFYTFGYGRFQKFYFDSMYASVKPYVDTIGEGKMLDVGCAYGFTLQRFPDSFEKFGADVSEHALGEAKKNLPNATLHLADAEAGLPFPENHFDIVVSNDVIEHLENPRLAIENMCKVLKKGGILYISTPNFNWLRKNFFAYADRKEHHISLLTHQQLADMLFNSGLEILDQYTFTNASFFFLTKFRSNLGHEQAFICRKTV